MDLVDSGARMLSPSGAVRDLADGKGRCDLLPFDVLAMYFANEDGLNKIFLGIHNYIYSGDTNEIIKALKVFSAKYYPDDATMFLEASKHYEDGAKKYSERNWEQGLPLHWYINSGGRHYLKVLRGDTDEPHDRAFVWNMLGAIRTQSSNPDMVDLPFSNDGAKKIIDTILNM